MTRLMLLRNLLLAPTKSEPCRDHRFNVKAVERRVPRHSFHDGVHGFVTSKRLHARVLERRLWRCDAFARVLTEVGLGVSTRNHVRRLSLTRVERYVPTCIQGTTARG